MCACPCSGRSLPPQSNNPDSCPAPGSRGGPGAGGGAPGAGGGGPGGRGGGPPQKRGTCGPKPCGGQQCNKCGKGGPGGRGGPGGKGGGPGGRNGPGGSGGPGGRNAPNGGGGGGGGPFGLSAPPNNRGPKALGLAALLFAVGVYLTLKMVIVASEIG
uniref:GEO10772p1 n=1 Tax=Drosophila melanogaster TaxID=7227 RepID=Q8INN3_DROME|eukprot:NP_731395.1 uncharacterized protein Dmel_CG31415 [Drosophila melanogaster]